MKRKAKPAAKSATPEIPAAMLRTMDNSYKVLSERKVELTPAIAEKLLSLPKLPGNRQLQQAYVTSMAIAMERGSFMEAQVVLATVKVGKDVYGFNGQHTANAVLLGRPMKRKYTVTWIDYETRTLDAARVLYSNFDQNYNRSKTHTIAVMLAGPEWENYPPALRKSLSEGVVYWLYAVRSERLMYDAAAVAAMLHGEYNALAHTLGKSCMPCYSSQEFRHLRRAPVFGAMFATFNVNRQASRKFWAAVHTGIGFHDKTDPRLTLRNILTTTKLTVDAKKHAMPGEEMYRRCIHYWNDWRNGTVTRFVFRLGSPRTEPV